MTQPAPPPKGARLCPRCSTPFAPRARLCNSDACTETRHCHSCKNDFKANKYKADGQVNKNYTCRSCSSNYFLCHNY